MKTILISLIVISCAGCGFLNKAITAPIVEDQIEMNNMTQFMEYLNNGWDIQVVDGRAVLVKEVEGRTLILDETKGK